MECKAFEIRDIATFIPVLATRMLPTAGHGSEEGQAEHYLLRRSGFNLIDPPASVMLCRMDADGRAHQASYDAYGWGMARTYGVAQEFIAKNWNTLRSGDVVDVEFILGETKVKKLSEAAACVQARAMMEQARKERL